MAGKGARWPSMIHEPGNKGNLNQLYGVIKKALGIEQLPVRAKDGLMKTIKSFIE